MSIAETVHFDKEGNVEPAWRRHLKKFYLSVIIILVAGLAFGLGRLSAPTGREGMKIEYDPSLVQNTPTGQTATVANVVGNTVSTNASTYASSKGTKYYYSYCKSNVSEKNKITFASASDAEAAGYTLAANCRLR